MRCPHCEGEFDYDLVPGASLTAVRLGTSRYMRCPLCHRFGRFSLRERESSMPEDAGASRDSLPSLPSSADRHGGTAGSGRGPTIPRFSDRRPLLRWGAVLLAAAVGLTLTGILLSSSFVLRVGLVGAGALGISIAAGLMILFGLPERVD